MRILCDAVPFGFGPAGKLLTILGKLPTSWDITLLASGTTKLLAERSQITGTIECDSTSRADLRRVKSNIENADLFLTVMNPVSARYAQEVGSRLAMVDSLFWMWHSAQDTCVTADMYFIQRFPDWERNLNRLRPVSPHPVGAIVGPHEPVERKEELLVHLGGLQNSIARADQIDTYCNVISRILAQALGHHRFDRIRVVGNPDPLKKAFHHCGVNRLEVTLLDHSDVARTLASSQLLLTSPGLTTTYEAFASGTPVAFLPPQNYSQLLISSVLRDIVPSPDWVDIGSLHDLLAGVPEVAGVKRVLDFHSALSAKLDDLDLHETYASLVANADARASAAHSQQDFIARIGAHGADEIVSEISRRS
ncbi:MAG: hypothetical protein GY835_03105 [bacterium]|nr:hypothetical protein [bacterium]